MEKASQAIKRIPRIRFPQRHPKPSSSGSQPETQAGSNDEILFFSRLNASITLGGKASLQPKRTPMSNDEIEAILLGGCT